MKRLSAAILSVALATTAVADGPSARQLADQAKAALEAGEFEQALEAYKQAEVTMPTSPELAYNRGVVHYKLGQYDDARESFSKALSTRDLSLEAKCKFNLGNVSYASALEKLSELQEAIDLLKTAMARYRDVLELDPDDADAKENIQKAQLLIKDLLDKLKKQQEEQQENQQQDDQDQQQQQSDQNQDSSDQQQDQQPQDGEQQDQQQGQEGEDQQQQEDEQSPSEQEDRDETGEQQQPMDTREMTREEAERMLQAVRDRERQRREELARRRMLRGGGVVKDW